MATLARLTVQLVADIAGFTAEMEKAQLTAVKAAEKIGKQWQQTGQDITNFGKNLTAGVTVPILAAGTAAVMAASDLEETKNKVSVVFGDMSTDVLAWGADSAMAFGLSQNAALQAAGTYGNLFVSMGMSTGSAADMSKGLVELAADLASFNNMDPTEVLDKLRSGITGQTEPLKALGVNMSATAISEKALAMGLADNVDALTDSAKAQAAYALIMEQTKTAQGDFARTSDGLANQQRILKAQLIDAAAALGNNLLPYVLQAVSYFNDLVTQFRVMSPETQQMVLIGLGLAAALGPVLIIVGQLVTAIGAIIPVVTAVAGVLSGPVLLVIGAVAAAVALLYMAWTNNWGGIQEKTQAAIAWIQGVIQTGLAIVQAFWQAHGAQIMTVVQAYWNILMSIVNGAMAVIQNIIRAFQAAMQGDWYAFGAYLRLAWDNLWRALGNVISASWEFIKTAITVLWTNIVTWFKSVNWKEVGNFIAQGIADGLKAGIQWIKDAALAAAQAALDAAKGFLGIQSPSKKMKQEVGYQMAAGVAEGWTGGLNTLMPATMPALSGSVRGVAPGSAGRSLGGVQIHINLQASGVVDEYETARRIGAAVGVILREKGLA
jgi:hypothetical protein